MSSSGATFPDATQPAPHGAPQVLYNSVNDKSAQLFIYTDDHSAGDLGKDAESLERNFLNQKSSSSTQHSTDDMLSSSSTSNMQNDQVLAIKQGSVPTEHQCSNSEQTAVFCEEKGILNEHTKSDSEKVLIKNSDEVCSSTTCEQFVERCGYEVGTGSFLPEELNKVRYLSCSEFTMKQGMDIGVFTVGEMLQFATEQPITYADILQCLTILRNKYEMLQLNTIKEEKSGKFYWAKLMDEKVFTTKDLGLLDDREAQQKFNGIVKEGIKDGEPIWRFFFAEINRSSKTGSQSDPVKSASQSSSTSSGTQKVPFESASKLSTSVTSSGDPLTRSSSERESATSEGESFRFSYCVYFVMSHALVDGIGIANIIADFFTLICTILIHNSGATSGSTSAGSPDTSSDHSASVDLEWPVQLTPVQVSPPYEELVPNLRLYRVMSLPLSFAFKRIMKTCLNMHKMPFFHHPIFKSPNLRPLMLQAPNTPVSAGTELLTFSAEEWSQFQAYRKRHGLTVSGLALALFSTAMVKYAYNGTHWPTTTLAAHILRDPRRYFKKTELDSRALVANYIASGLMVLLPFFKRKRRERKKKKAAGDCGGASEVFVENGGRDMEKLVVDLAKLVTQQIRGNVKNFQTFFYGEVQRRLSKDTELVKQFVDVFSSHPGTCGRMTMIQFSNIGEISCVNQPLCGDFNSIFVQKSIALADQSKSGDCFCNVLMTIQGRLHWTISYPTHLYPPDKVAAMASEMRQLWSQIIRPDNIEL